MQSNRCQIPSPQLSEITFAAGSTDPDHLVSVKLGATKPPNKTSGEVFAARFCASRSALKLLKPPSYNQARSAPTLATSGHPLVFFKCIWLIHRKEKRQEKIKLKILTPAQRSQVLVPSKNIADSGQECELASSKIYKVSNYVS